METKVQVGRMKPDLVSRLHLLQSLEGAVHHKLTLISASAGYGKSTLLKQWASQTALEVAWLSLDGEDNEPGRFLIYLINALRTLRSDLGQATLALLASPQQTAMPALMTGLLHEISGMAEPFALILDDYHLIENPKIHEAVTLLLTYLPPAMHLLIASRTDPPLPLARLRAQGELLELRFGDLRFQTGESATFLNEMMQLHMDPPAITRLVTLTEGWIAGLQLAALALQNRDDPSHFLNSFSGDHRYIFDYLASEVFSQQDEATRQFLLQTAILDRLNGELGEAVTGQEGGQTRLAQLERANLFVIPLDDEQRWYRYHHLFADFLRRRLEQQFAADLVEQLHRRAATWYQTAELIEEALKHWLAANDFEQMATLLEQYAPQIWTQGQMPTLRQWAGHLPEEILWAKPHLALAYISTLIDTKYLDQAERYLRQVETLHKINQQPGTDLYHEVLVLRCTIAYFRHDVPTALSLVGPLEQHLPQQNLHLRSLFSLNLGSIYALKGEPEKAVFYLQEAARSAHLAGSIYLALLTGGQLASMQMSWGQLQQAYQSCQQALQLFKQPLPVSGWIYFYMAELLYEWNDLEAAGQALATGFDLYRHRENLATSIGAYPLLARIKFYSGDHEAARQVMQEAVELSQQQPEPYLLSKVLAQQAELALAQGQLETAGRWAETQSHQPETIIQSPYETGRALAGTLIAQGRPEEALALLASLETAAVAQKQVGQIIQIKARQALARQALGDQPQALKTLNEALTMAQPGGYIRSFVDTGLDLVPLLTQVAQASYATRDRQLAAYTQKLLEAFPGEIPVQVASLPLTPRELEVLGLIAAGLTNQQIAAELVIARGTVKKHIDNLYAKLEVRNRTQAVAQARLLRLIP